MSSNGGPLYWDPQKPWGNELVANTLAEQGVECVFCLTGDHIAPMLTAISERGIRVVGTHTEAAAVLAAAGYAMTSGKTGVACLTAGMLGFAHAAMLSATWGQVPVVVIAGASETYADGMRALQEIEQPPIARSAQVKDAFHCNRWERIPQMITWAFRSARSGVPGCAFVDIPIDVLCSQGDPALFSRYRTCSVESAPGGDPELVRQALSMLAKAEKPLINVGRLGAAAVEEMKQFVELTGIPVDACAGTLGSHPLSLSYLMCFDADVVLTLGRASQGIEGGLNANMYQGKIIAVFPDSADIGRCYPVELGITGDVRVVLRQMIVEAKNMHFPDRLDWVKELRERQEGGKTMFGGIASSDGVPVHPARLIKETIEWMQQGDLNKDAVMTVDGGDCIYWWAILASAYGFPTAFPGQMVGLTALQMTLGAVGMGLGMGLGSACARPGKMLLVPVMGDGALGYHFMELETLARLKIPAVIVVHNNSAWGMVYADQRRIWGRSENAGSVFSPGIRYEKAAEALGCAPGEYVTQPEQIRPALEKAYKTALRESKPVLVNVITDANIYIMPFPWWNLPATEKGEAFSVMGGA
jgi:acetolactate synthase I/II/III large subunit